MHPPKKEGNVQKTLFQLHAPPKTAPGISRRILKLVLDSTGY